MNVNKLRESRRAKADPVRMVYKAPGPLKLHGVMVKTLNILDTDDAIEAAQGEGWHLTPAAAAEAYELELADEVVKAEAAKAAAVKAEAAKATKSVPKTGKAAPKEG